MKKSIFLLLFLMTITFCNAQKNKSQTPNKILEAKNWLIKNIENQLNSNNGLAENTNEEADGEGKSIYTKDYELYKSDALQIDLDGGMTSAQFKKKWEKKFQTKFAGESVGFLISAQDWGLIKVIKCAPLISTNEKVFWFKTTIYDTENKLKYNRDIKVIPSGKSFLIADVLEYN
ncbi:hypothetical protein N6B72_20785 [Chryseobacterium soli]|uniref:hypothetical protein n=1 Tax=Chryseobacterium soli TaxID=445961 RepID=UPI000B225B55|nr:hypothetical protein [Chryseobacterium soli]MDV7699362.1 hypothetical protein [Chryseobacterium soli]